MGSGFVISMALNWPGNLSFDLVVQLLEGRTARYGNWHPPVMSWLLGVFDGWLPGTGLFIAFDAALLFGALAVALFLTRKAGWAGTVVALVAVLTPQFLLYAGIVWKDVLFGAAAVAGFLCLALAARVWNRTRLRAALLAATGLGLVLGALARQNGAVVLPIAALALGWIALRRHENSRALNAIFYGVGSLSLMLFLFGASILALETRDVGQTGPKGQFRLLDTYDLAGALHDDPGLDLDSLNDDDPALAAQMRTNAARLYTPERNDTLASSAPLQAALLNADENAIPAQWRAFVMEHPLLYLKVRWDAFRALFFTPDLAGCRPIFAGVIGPPAMLSALHMKVRFDARDRFLTAYGWAFAGTPVLSHAAFGALALFELYLLIRRRRNEDIAIGAMLASAFVFTASFFVISIACDYRYLYFLDVAALIALAYLAQDWRELWAAYGLRRRS